MNIETKAKMKEEMKYQNLFWLFMIANIFGVLLEGIWTLYKFGRWESHVVTIWGPFCLLYGAGAIAFYFGSVLVRNRHILVQFLTFALIADLLEYVCAWAIDAGLGMKAWTYKKHFMNLQGRISLQMTIIWGVIGVLYYYLLIPRILRLLQKLQTKFLKYACILLTIFMIVNLAFTTVCLLRWSKRHKGMEATNRFEEYIDEHYDNDFMRKRFCEWWFIDEAEEFWQSYKR